MERGLGPLWHGLSPSWACAVEATWTEALSMYIYTGFRPACPMGRGAPGNPVQTCLQGKEDMSGIASHRSGEDQRGD